MTTYTAIFRNSPTSKPDSVYDEAGIEDALEAQGASSVEIQRGNPNSSQYVLAQFEADLVYSDVEFAMKNAFELGYGPIRLVEGNFSDARSWAQDAMITDIWSTYAMETSHRQDQETQELLDLINRRGGRNYRNMNELHADKSNTYPLLSLIRDLAGQIQTLTTRPELPELEREKARIEGDMAGMIERYAALEAQWIRVIFQMYPEGMAKHPRYQGLRGQLNLHLQDVINYYRSTYAETGNNGEYLEGADELLGDFASNLINYLDGEVDLKMTVEMMADETLRERGIDPYYTGHLPLEERQRIFTELDSRFHDEYHSGIAEVRRQLGLPAEDED